MDTHAVQFVAVTLSDGSLAVMQFVLDPRLPGRASVPGYNPQTGRREATDEAIQYEIDKSAWGEGVTAVGWRRIDAAEVPQDRTYRNAWTDTGRGIGHDMPKARELHRQRLRDARAPLLAEADVEFMKALERDEQQTAKRVAARKQELRDVTADPRIEAARTVEELKAVWPL